MLDCSKHTPKSIITLISSGDIDAYYCIVEKYEEKLLRYILRITSVEREDAENILQEVFIKAYTNIHGYNAEYPFSSRIYRIAHNHAIDYFRKNKNKQQISLEGDEQDYGGLLEILDSGENIERSIYQKELREKIKSILKTLDIKYREILILKFLEEKNYEEISDILQIPSGTVATLISRGKKQFRAKAQEQGLKSYIY